MGSGDRYARAASSVQHVGTQIVGALCVNRHTRGITERTLCRNGAVNRYHVRGVGAGGQLERNAAPIEVAKHHGGTRSGVARERASGVGGLAR